MSAKPGPATGREPILQRLAIVLPSTGEFDSRTYRLARAAAARGHAVTVLARWAPGLAEAEDHPAGYRVVRVHVSAVDGLPMPPGVRRWVERHRRGRPQTAPDDAGTDGGAPADPPDAPGTGSSSARGRPWATGAGAIRRASRAFLRTASIVLTVRSQTRATRAVDPGADIYHAMAYMGIPVGLDLGRRAGARVVYDARDIYVDANNLARLPAPVRRLLRRVERDWARDADARVTVNRPYAEVLARRWDVAIPLVVLNCSYRYEPSTPRSRRFHEALGLPPATRVVLYQGGFSRHRGIEQLMAAIREVPDAVLVLLGYGTLQAELETRASSADLGGRVHVLPAVAPADLLDWVAAADVVALPIQPSTLNHRLTTPNKLFEAIAVGVPVVASDLPGIAGIVREVGAGVLVDPTDPSAIARALRAVLEGDDGARAATTARMLSAAHDTYNWETQVEGLLREYERLTGRPW